MGPIHCPSSEDGDWRQSRRDHHPLSATPSSDKRASRALTQASLMAMVQQWNSSDSSSTNNSASSLHLLGCPILPDESVSVVCGFNTKQEEDPAANLPIPSGDEIIELSGADWRRNLSKRFATINGFYKFVQAWGSKMQAPAPVLDFAACGTKLHWKCTVDPVSGELLDPVVFPDTLRDESALDSDRMRLRRRTRTSSSAAKEYTILFGPEGKAQTDKTDTGPSESVGDAGQDDTNKENEAPAKGSSQANNSVLPDIKEEEEEHEQEAATFSKLPNGSRTSLPLRTLDVAAYQQPTSSATPDPGHAKMAEHAYYIRPAGMRDMKGVQDIYNFEVAKGTQARDVEPLEVEDLVSILETCRKAMLPFLVAAPGPGPDKADVGHDGPESVLGFGFLSIYEPGLAGGLNGTSRYSVKANVFVHVNERQKGVGGALLSKLLELCSFNYTAKEEHVVPYVRTQDAGVEDTGLYGSCRESPRQYHQVFAEVLYGSERGLAEMWYERVLARDFGFQCLGKSVIGVHWSNVGQCWLSKLVFQHDCYPPVEDIAAAETRTPTRSPSHPGGGREGTTVGSESPAQYPSMEPSVERSPSEPASSQMNGGVRLEDNSGNPGNRTNDVESKYW